MGLAITAEYEDLLARGYPHLRRLIEDHPHDADAHAWAVKALSEGDPKHYFVDWPAAVARRYLRGYARSRNGSDAPPVMHAAAVDGPIDEAEGRALIAQFLDAEHYQRYEFHAHHALFLVEAHLGSVATADAVLGELEAMAVLDAKYDTRTAFAYALGFVIRRLGRAERARAEQRITALIAKHAAAVPGYTRDYLSFVVGGREALERTRRRLELGILHFCDDPSLVLAAAAQSVVGWDAHHVVLAGEAVLDALTPKAIKKIWKGHKERTIEQLGRLASPKAVAVLEEFGKTAAHAKRVEAALAGRTKIVAGAKAVAKESAGAAKSPAGAEKSPPAAKKSAGAAKSAPAKKSVGAAKSSPAAKRSAGAAKSPAAKAGAMKPAAAKKVPAKKHPAARR